TEAPDKADHLGDVDHRAKKETRIADSVQRDRAKDPGQKGKPDATAQSAQGTPQKPQTQPTPKRSDIEIQPKGGTLSMDSMRPKPRNSYEALLPNGAFDLKGQMEAGFQDY